MRLCLPFCWFLHSVGFVDFLCLLFLHFSNFARPQPHMSGPMMPSGSVSLGGGMGSAPVLPPSGSSFAVTGGGGIGGSYIGGGSSFASPPTAAHFQSGGGNGRPGDMERFRDERFESGGGGGRGGRGGTGRSGDRGGWAGGGARGFDSGRGGGVTGSGFHSGRGGSVNGRGYGFGSGGKGRGLDGGRGSAGGRGSFGGGRGGSRDGFGSRNFTKPTDDLDRVSLPTHTFHNLIPFEKNFYLESPSVQAMSEQEAMFYRRSRQIITEGHDIPKPFRFFDEANFPGNF